MSAFDTFIIFVLLVPTLGATEENPFMAVRDRYQWAIGEVMGHKAPGNYTEFPATDEKAHKGKNGLKNTPTTVFEERTYQFKTETDKARVNAEVTDFGNSFLVEVTSDQVIQGWLLKRQSTRDVFLKGMGSADSPYQCRIRVERPYLKDFGLTVYVTRDSDPAFIQLF